MQHNNVKALILQATEAQRNHQWSVALNAWSEALRIKPELPGALLGKALALEQTGQNQEAIAIYETGSEAFPDTTGFLLGLGRIAERAKDFQRAAIIYRDIIQRWPDQVPALLGAARCSLRTASTDDARAYLALASVESPNDERIERIFKEADQVDARRLATQAASANDLEQHEEALDFWDQAIALTPVLPDIWIGKTRTLEALNRYEQAISTLQEAAQRWPDRYFFPARLASILEVCERWSDSLSVLEDSAHKWPERPEPVINRVRLLVKLMRYEEAAAIAQEGLKRFPDEPRLVRNRAEATSTLQPLDQTLSNLKADVAAFPQDGHLRLRLTEALEEACLRDQALAESLSLFHSLSDKPEDLIAFWSGIIAARLLCELGDGEQSSAILKILAAHHLDKEQFYHNAANILHQIGESQKALMYLRECLKRFPTSWIAYERISEILNDVKPAGGPITISDFDDEGAVSVFPSDDIRSSMGSFLESTKTFKRSLVDAPDIEIVVSPEGSSGIAVLSFVGLRRNQRGVPLLLERYLASRGIDAIYAKDTALSGGLSGFSSIGDTFEMAVDHLRELIDKRNIKRLCVVGRSAGGLAAVHYGTRLGASRIIGFSMITNVTEAFLRSQGLPTRMMIKRVNRDFREDILDVKPTLLKVTPSPRVNLFYGADHAPDRGQAVYLKDVPNVVLHPVPGCQDHNVFPRMIMDGSFISTMDKLLIADDG